MRFRSERDQQLAIEVIRQMVVLVDSLLRRMAPVEDESDLRETETGHLLLDAVCMQYLALGESAKQLDKLTGYTLNEQFPGQDWKGVMGFRDVLAHQYFNVDPRQVLWVTRETLPKLHDTLKDMLDALEAGGR